MMRFEILKPIHGESGSIWNIWDNDRGEIIGTINQKGEIKSNIPLNYKYPSFLDEALNSGDGVYRP